MKVWSRRKYGRIAAQRASPGSLSDPGAVVGGSIASRGEGPVCRRTSIAARHINSRRSSLAFSQLGGSGVRRRGEAPLSKVRHPSAYFVTRTLVPEGTVLHTRQVTPLESVNSRVAMRTRESKRQSIGVMIRGLSM